MATDPVVLFEEDFAQLPIRTIAGDYSPAGEYHVVEALADSGRWREPLLHHSYRHVSYGNWQVVPEGDQRHVLGQTAQIEKLEAMLAAGDVHWRNVTLTVTVRPLTQAGWRAVVFRYRHGRRFYALVFDGEEARIVRRDNDQELVLAWASCRLDPDRYVPVRIACRGHRVIAEVDGRRLMECEDASEGAFEEGAVALAARQVTRFADVRVTTDAATAGELAAQAKRRAASLGACRSRYPRPRLWRKIRTPRWGTDRNLRVGDIDGDGRPEIVLGRRTDRWGGDNFSFLTSLAAYDLDGRQLWTLGEPDRNARQTTSDLCFQLQDIDGDGRAELIYAWNWELRVAQGATGRTLRSIVLPHRADRDPNKPWRMIADSIHFCDLAGSGRPDSVLLKDRYKNLYAYDRDLAMQWSFSGNLGHYPHAADINGDGRDEVAIGYSLLGHDGRLLWQGDMADHADNVALVNLHRPMLLIAASDAGFHMIDLDGQSRLRCPIGHAQALCVARLLPRQTPLQIMVNTFWGAAGIHAVFDADGRLIDQFEPMPYACLLQPVNWVPLAEGVGPADLVLLSTHPRQGGLIDGHGQRLVMFEDDGHPVLCSDARDLDGDGIDEVLTWNEEEIWIYKADVPGRTPVNYPRRPAWFNDSNYRAQLSIPRVGPGAP
jgi:hypothetical protein